MKLSPGTKLGPYEIQSQLGAGGMGEVYRALDIRLDRIVAVKILPAHLAEKSDARERFDREARAISSLSHPNICPLYDVGSQDGLRYLVMEYLEGETLADRLMRGQLPLEQLLKYGIEICEGLDKAHRTGVVHRDLKPGNIMLTKLGAKLMDFGLAKSASPAFIASGLSATITSLAESHPLTADGTVVGTFQYMSPEQVEGKEVDGRSDIFSFGSVLYEMVTGRRAFPGKSQFSVASAILDKDPDPIIPLQPLTPPALDRAICRCLAKDPENRWQMVRDLLLELKWIAEAGSQAGVPSPLISHRKTSERVAWAAAAALALVALAFAIGFARSASKPPQSARLIADIGTDASLRTSSGTATILSPDGSQLAFVAAVSGQKPQIYVRTLDQLQATALSGTENANDPFFSTDGQWLGFFADGKLKKILVRGGAAVTLCDAHDGRGGSWGEDGTIVFTPYVGAPLTKISSAGGTPQSLTSLDAQAGELTHRWPQVLPGGNAVLFTSSTEVGNYENADIVVYSMASGQRKTVQRGGFHARYVFSGHVVYMHEGTLFAVPFDLKRLEVTGPPAPILDGIVTNPATGGAQFSLSDTGNLVYVAGGSVFQNFSIYWMDREGKFTPMRERMGSYLFPTFSPEGKRLAVQIRDSGGSDIWVYQWERDLLTRITFGSQSNSPIWTRDGQRITYSSSEKGGAYGLYWTRADGAGDALRLTARGKHKRANSWSPDDKTLAFMQLNPDTSWDIMTLSIEGDPKSGWKVGEPRPFLSGPFIEQDAAFSPDGRWLAYASDETGKLEVYVKPFPGPGGRWQISAGGGSSPRWSRSSKELFYRAADQRIMVTTYATTGDSFDAGKAGLWSPSQFGSGGPTSNFDLHPDGKRLVVLKAPSGVENAPVNKVTFFFNFFEELRRKVPAGKN